MDLCQPDLPETLTELVRQNGLAPSQLRLEITESAYVDKPDRLIAQVNQLRDAGVQRRNGRFRLPAIRR